MYLKKIIYSIILIGFLHANLQGQINFSVGYDAVYSPFEGVNTITRDYNSQSSLNLEQPMKELHFINGITLGARYKYENIGTSLSWVNYSRDRDALGLITNDEAFTESIYYKFSGLSLGLEAHFGKLSVGASMDRNKLIIKTDIANTDSKRKLSSQTQWASTFYASVVVQQSDWVSLALQPYFQIPWNGYDTKALAVELNSTSTKAEKSLTFGLKIIFYNGWQDEE